ncbi:MAG: dynamin family protein [Rubrivivax sp.]|nr:dynamin family protein [Rubrivivax sp.]MBK7260972.1 dynamin family protein [Rubrivivax sp.]MBK8525904.1 dynamin family protein [Rubrivivax sp.]
MHSSIVTRLDELAGWRADVDRAVTVLARFLVDHELIDEPQTAALAALRERLASDRLVLAFVAEFSRGKSELINAIFFAGAGRRVLPATPGRTTMCPVELFHDASAPARLSLLPIETRLRGLSLADLRKRDEPWQHVPLEIDNPQALARALEAVTRTQRVSVETATALGFWSDEQADDNPPQAADGTVEVPAWRHALINYPHPLLRRGLVVIDTPGLNAIGAEPELTLGLLPTAHATVFVLAADTGVTKSDLAIWREHLASNALERYVVLNKIDALYDPLSSEAEVQAQISKQREKVADTLGLPASRVFALSAREGLAARVSGSAGNLERSNLGELEDALSTGLLPRQRELLEASVAAVVNRVRQVATRRIGQNRRHQNEQMLELKGLRGKSGGKVRLMLQRVDAESADFERCIARLQAVRAVQQRMLKSALARISNMVLRSEVTAMQSAMGARPFNLGGKAAFVTLCGRLKAALGSAQQQADEIREMLDASFMALNAEYGFAFAKQAQPELQRFARELDLIEHNYSHYLGLLQAWRMASPGFMEQFRRMLMSKLRVVFESACSELELWSRTASNQVDQQLGDRRRAFKQRREALQRIQSAAGELEQRIGEVETQDTQLAELQRLLDTRADEVLARAHARAPTAPIRPEAVSPQAAV